MTVVFTVPRLRERLDVRFAYRFVVLAIIILSAWTIASPTWAAVRRLTTGLVLVGARVTVLPGALFDGDIVTFTRTGQSFSYHVDDECTGVQVMITYLLAVAAYPTGVRQRVLGLVGIPVLLGLNVVRLVVLGWVGLYWNRAFDEIHLYWWQALYVAGAGLIWFLWAWFTGGSTPRPRWKAPRVFLAVPATVVGVLVAMAALGSWAGGMDAHAGAMAAIRQFIGERLWGGALPIVWRAADRRIVEYGLLSATMALFLAAPEIDLRRRVRAALVIGAPAAMVLEVALSIVLVTLRLHGPGPVAQAADGTFIALGWALHIGIVLIAWQAWFVREQIRRERQTVRRKAARHGSTHRLARAVPEPSVRTSTRWVTDTKPILPIRELRRRR